MFKKLFAALIASAFALSVFAQAPKSGTEKAEPKGPSGVTTEKAKPGKGESDSKATTTKKAKPKKAKAKTKAEGAKTEGTKTDAKKSDTKAEPKKDATK